MTNTNTLLQKLPDILEIARLAPSVHNTQPWRVSARDSTITVQLDHRHVLTDGDPTGRETSISLGIFCEAVTIAAGQLGFKLVKAQLTEGGAQMDFKVSSQPTGEAKLIGLLKRRASDRSIYQAAELTPRQIDRITTTGNRDIKVSVLTDRSVIVRVAELTARGIGLAMSSPGFRRELSRYLVLPLSRKRRGIAVSSLYIPFLLAIAQPLMVRLGWSIKAEAVLEKKRWLSASGVVVLMADGDLARFWFEAGRVYLRASLAIEDLGLSQATSAAIVEASDYHEDIEQLLKTNQRILAMIRIGRGHSKRRFSPRVTVDELLT